MSLRILMISDVYFPRINGVSTSIQTFCKEFEKQGHQVTLIAPEYPQLQCQDPQIIRIRSKAVLFDPEDRMMRYRDIIKLLPQLRDSGFDLIHIHTPFVAHYSGIKLAGLLRIPIVVTYHTLFEEYLFHYIPFVPRAVLRAFTRWFSHGQCNQVDGVVAPSGLISDLLRKYGVRKPIEIIPTGIHCHKFRVGDGAGFRARYNIPANRKLLLNVSRIAFEKNIGVLIQALDLVRREIPEVFMVIAGEGPAKSSYIQQVSEMSLEDHVAFVGYLNRDSELIDCYHSADLFVFSSLTETQGLVLLEAMAAGTPVVAVSAMGTSDILDGCPGAVVSTGDPIDFAKKICGLLQDRNALSECGKQAGIYAEKWSADRLANRMLNLYLRTLAGVNCSSAPAVSVIEP